ncbi:MAG: thymidine phosphorylase [Puniceicoccales bacterium]|jgi:pyrimidine-nucleoside phosphorylase|nr:thymidine phosphorylase [Puniceicoccales bacterium]
MAEKHADSKLTAKKTSFFATLIEKKRDGGEFTKEEIRQIVDAIMDHEMPPEQQAALAMAIYFKQMTAQETAVLAEEMKLSGDILDLDDVRQKKISKISTGGVGDKTTLILAALGAAVEVVVPCMNLKDEEFIISNVAKISVIPGIKTKFTLKEYGALLRKTGAAFVEQFPDVAPADDLLYILRQNTATIPSLPLIAGSILAKKLAEGSDGLVVDIKWGNGSFLRDKEQAKQLARTITRVARSMNRKCAALVTDSNQPIGDSVGTALEIKEAVLLLSGEGLDIRPPDKDGNLDPLRDLKELVLKLGMEIVRFADVAGSTLSARQIVDRHIKDGSALKKLREIVAAQGGKTDWFDDPTKFPQAKYVRKLPAPKRGYVHTIDAGKIAVGVQVLATGDATGEVGFAKADPAVGITNIKKVGTQVKQGEPLIMIHYNDEARMEKALPYFRDAYRLAPKRPKDEPLVLERVA